MKIKICHITSAHQYNDVRIFLKECSSLSAAGYDVALLHAGHYSGEINGVKIIGVNVQAANRLQRMIKTVNALFAKAILLDAVIYHLHDPELMRAGKKLLAINKKVIYDAHEDLPRQISGKHWIPSAFRKIISATIEKYENAFARKVTAVIGATPFIRQRFEKLNKNTIDINNFPILSEFQISSGEKKNNEICYIGGISRIRGSFELIKSLEKTNVRLNLAGTFDTPETEAEIKKLNAWKQVNFYGFVDRKQINEILSRSSIGIVTLYPQINYLDSLPIKMFEYMAAGVPVLASDFPYWKQIVESNDCGITVNPKNADDISTAINSMMSNKNRMNEMGANGKKAVAEKYNWEKEKLKLINLYQSLS